MRLAIAEAQKLIKSPVNADAIRAAREHEDRLVFHCEPVLDTKYMPQFAIQQFFEWVESFLPKDKVKRFKQLLTLPVDTVESTKAIFDELSKFLNAQDRYINFQFTADAISADFNDYLARLNDANFWRQHGMQSLATRINSMLVVDCPDVQLSMRPEPYYYFVDIHNIRDAVLEQRTGRVEYIIFDRLTDKAVIVIDDEFYRVFVKPEHSDDYILTAEAAHSVYSDTGEVLDGLGYCPVTSFYSNPIYNGKRLNNRGPVTDVLGKLNWLLFWRTSKKYLDLYGAWPIIVTYKSECTYRDAKGEPCHDGYIVGQEWDGTRYIDTNKPCPACTAKETIGPGSYWEVDAPADKDDVDLLKQPVTIVEVSNDKLEYGVSEIERLESEVYLDCVGYDGEVMGDQAVNSSQVKANFESKEAVLDGIKAQFERAHKFVMDTVCRLRYGSYFAGSVVDYGTEYFLKSSEDLTKEYDESKKAGMPNYYLATLRDQVRRTRFRNNPQQMQRDDILSHLEPYPDLTPEQLVALQINTMDPLGYIVKLNFYSFIKRFETEQTDVSNFGSLMPLKNKIQLITQKLQDYARQKQDAASAQHEPGTTGRAATATNGRVGANN